MKFLNQFLFSTVVILTLSFAGYAQAWDTGKELSQVNFSSTDINKDGLHSFQEITQMASDIAFSIDTDANKMISSDEFSEWDFGYLYLAEKEGKDIQYNAVKEIIFALMDINSDKNISAEEFRLSVSRDFERADFNHDRMLSETEYLNGWTPIIILKTGYNNFSK